jgi:lipopolysaccharide export system protein LptA
MAIYMRIIVFIAFMVSAPATVFALKNDKNEPAVINAENTEFDFRTGTRTWIGKVTVRQGTLRIKADKLVATYKGNVLQSATAYGNPAIFTQRPENQTEDVIGKGLSLKLDEANNLVTFLEQASLKQGSNTVNGKKIIYNMTTEKMKVFGGMSRGTTTTVDQKGNTTIGPGSKKKPDQKKKSTKSEKATTTKSTPLPSKKTETSVKQPSPVAVDQPIQPSIETSPSTTQRPHIRLMPSSKPKPPAAPATPVPNSSTSSNKIN